MLQLYNQQLSSRLMQGTARYPNGQTVIDAFAASKAEVATVSLRRQEGADPEFRQVLQQLDVKILPNTAGCFDVQAAVTTAQMARELFNTNWIKLEVLGSETTLQPDVIGTLEATKILVSEGFAVFPYCTEDLSVAEKLLHAGCQVLMPWGAPIGSVRGLNNPYGLQLLRQEFPDIPLIVDAGIGLPSHAAQVMEMGYDAVLMNSAIAKAGNPVQMAQAMAQAIQAGRAAYLAQPAQASAAAQASSPTTGLADL